MCYIIALKNSENIKNKQNTQTIEQNRTKNDKNNNKGKDDDMSSFYILGIDQSTQGTKAVLFDKYGKIIARADEAHKQIVSDQNWVSHNLEEIYANVIKASRQVVEKAGIDKKQIVCIGIDNQRETTAAWNRKTGKPIADAIVWQCSRAKDICKRVGENGVSGEKIYRRTGLKLSPYYPAGKMAWFLENIPGARELAENGELALGTMDSWLVYKLTGGKEFKTDYSNASRTQLMDIKNLVWDKEMCELFQIPMNTLPQICDSDSTFGYTDLEGYLDKEISICGILGDSHGALYGHNCRQAGGIKTTYGTGSSVMMNTGETPFFSEHGLSTSLAWRIKGKASYVLEGNINYTGAVISWLKDNLRMISSPGETEELARKADPNDHTYIVPAFSGLGAPWWRDDIYASISGMSRTTGREEIVRAGCDCIAYQINDVIEAMRKDSQIDISQMCVDGGPTRNKYLMQFQSDILDIPVQVPDAEELSAMGPAYAAGIAMGIYEQTALFESLNRTRFAPEMDAETRCTKYAGWKESVGLVLTK